MRYLLLMSVLFLTGCVSDVANRYYSHVKYPPKEISEVEILKGRPDREFEVIADFQSRGESAKAMQKRAAAIGADAVIVTFVGGYASLSSNWAGDDPYSNTHSRVLGTAIKFK